MYAFLLVYILKIVFLGHRMSQVCFQEVMTGTNIQMYLIYLRSAFQENLRENKDSKIGNANAHVECHRLR